MKPTFLERKEIRREELKAKVSPKTLMRNLKEATSEWLAAERELASLETSLYWNTVHERVAAAERKYTEALNAVSDALHRNESQ